MFARWLVDIRSAAKDLQPFVCTVYEEVSVRRRLARWIKSQIFLHDGWRVQPPAYAADPFLLYLAYKNDRCE